MQTKFLFGAFTASSGGVVYLDIIKKTRIRVIQFSVCAHLDAEGELYRVELSRSPTFQASTHDALGILAVVSDACFDAGTPATSILSGKEVVIPCDCILEAGERLYLNAVLTNTTDVQARVVLHVD